jgi:hypothetical protein
MPAGGRGGRLLGHCGRRQRIRCDRGPPLAGLVGYAVIDANHGPAEAVQRVWRGGGAPNPGGRVFERAAVLEVRGYAVARKV